MASSCCSSTASSPWSPSCLLLRPFHDRFRDIPEPTRSQIIGTSIKIIQENIKKIAIRNLQHELGWAGGRCRACIADLGRAVKAAEGVGVEVDAKCKSLLVDLQYREGTRNDYDDEAQLQCCWVCLQNLKRQQEEEEEEKEEKDREFKRHRNSILAYMKYLEEAEDNDEEEEEEKEEDDDDDEILEIYD